MLFVKTKHFNFTDPQIQFLVMEHAEKFVISLNSKAFAKFVEIDLSYADVILSDNYFDLSAGVSKTISVEKSDISICLSLSQLKEKLKIRSIYDTYEKSGEE